MSPQPSQKKSREAAERPWYAEGLRFSCTQCGNCCSGAPGYVWVTEEEAAGIAAYLNLSVEEFGRQHLRRIGQRLSLREWSNGDCEWLVRYPDGKTKCAVHPARPVQCRTWPFWESNLESPAAWRAAGRTCPGLNVGAFHPLPVIQEQRHAGAARAL
jgi:uncharacterized protein